MNAYETLKARLLIEPRLWLVTGVAGFIGSHLLETLLGLNQRVIGLDNYSTGSRRNLEQVRDRVRWGEWNNFLPLDGDIRDLETCRRVSAGVDYVLHHAALDFTLGSLARPEDFHGCNVTGFLNMLIAAREKRVRRIVYAADNSTNGADSGWPRLEDSIELCPPPYAASKRTNEIYAEVFARCYGVQIVGLRYPNVFGERQNLAGQYAKVIPAWIATLTRSESVHINGSGGSSCDFCYVANVVQANLLAATMDAAGDITPIYDIAAPARTTLDQLHQLLRERFCRVHSQLACPHLDPRDPVATETVFSPPSVSKVPKLPGYEPTHSVGQGISESVVWYEQQVQEAWRERTLSPRSELSKRTVRNRRRISVQTACSLAG